MSSSTTTSNSTALLTFASAGILAATAIDYYYRHHSLNSNNKDNDDIDNNSNGSNSSSSRSSRSRENSNSKIVPNRVNSSESLSSINSNNGKHTSDILHAELPLGARSVEGRRSSFSRRGSFQRASAKSNENIITTISPIIDKINDEVVTHSFDDKPLIVGIAGGTGSGKTTLSNAIYDNLGADFVTYIAHDSYYKDLSHLQKEERAQMNFDHPDSLDTNLLIKHLQDLQSGKHAIIPTYDFKTHTRLLNTSQEVVPRRVILVEGILIFSDPELVKMIDIKVFVDTDADIRLIRRITRDTKDRGRDLDSVVNQYISTVRPMHTEFVEPSKRVADIIVPTGINAVALDLVISRLRFEIGV